MGPCYISKLQLQMKSYKHSNYKGCVCKKIYSYRFKHALLGTYFSYLGCVSRRAGYQTAITEKNAFMPYCYGRMSTHYNGPSGQTLMMDPLSYFSFQPVLHIWYNKGHGMCYPVCGMMHIKDPLLLIGEKACVWSCGGHA